METTTVIPTATDIQMDYMKLLVTQLKNQNPLEPLDNNEMASQLAQLSQLQQLETMSSNFARMLASVQRAYASSLIGKEVSFIAETETGALDVTAGTVQEVHNDVDGKILLDVGSHIVPLENILSVKN
jgi:flagellar basal-body rod modification protein FlgD